MDLQELQANDLESVFNLLEESPADADFYSHTTGLAEQGSLIGQDATLASRWLNTASFSGFNVPQLQSEQGQGEIFSDTESVTSSSYSAVPSPGAAFDDTDPQQFNFIVQDDELKHLSVKDLNHRLKGLPKDIISNIKRRRRTLKNRGYAHICRIKRVNEKNTLQNTKVDLEAVNNRLHDELRIVRDERDRYKQAYEQLVQLIQDQGRMM